MTVIFSVIYGATVFAITTPGLVPEQVLWLGQAANIPMVVLGKMIQVIANFRQGTIHILRKHFFAGIYILQKIRNYANLKIQNGKTLPKLNIGIYSKFGQYYRYDITMYDFIHIIQFLIPIWSWISKMMLENETFFHFSFEMLLRLHSYLNLL